MLEQMPQADIDRACWTLRQIIKEQKEKAGGVKNVQV